MFSQLYRSRLVKNFLSIASIKLLSIPLSLISTIILARILGPDAYGQYAFILAFIPILALPIAAGIPQLLTREIASFAQSNKWRLYKGIIYASYFWVISAFIIGCTLYWAFTNFILDNPPGGKWTLMPIALILVFFTGLNAIRNGILRGLKFPFLASLPEMLIQPVLLLAILGILIWKDALSPQTALMSQLVAVFTGLIIASIFVKKVQPAMKEEKAEFNIKLWIQALLPFTFLYIFTTINLNIGTVLLGFLAEDSEVAAMRIAERIGQFISLPLQIVNLVISPYIVEAWNDKNLSQLQKLTTRAARSAFAMSLPMVILVLLWGDTLIALVFGAEYVDIASRTLKIVAIAHLINVFFGSVGILLSMSGHERHTLFGQLTATVISVPISVLLIPHYGAVGAALGVVCSFLVWNSLLAFAVHKYLRIRPSAI